MTRFAANVSILFRNVPLLDRPDLAARHGFREIEMWWPTAADLEGGSIEALTHRIRDAGVELVLLNFDAGDMAAGERGLANDPTRTARFRENIPTALRLAEATGCRKLNALAGNRIEGLSEPAQRQALQESVARAADDAASRGMTVLLEPLNTVENPRYLLPSTAAAIALADSLGRPNVQVQFDVYHAAMNGEDVLASIAMAGSRIGHVQIADMPGRHEPGTGTLPFGEILHALEIGGYRGSVGLEYVPTDPSHPSFAYLPVLAESAADPGSWRPAPASIPGA